MQEQWPDLVVETVEDLGRPERLAEWQRLRSHRAQGWFRDPRWLLALQQGLDHRPFVLEARRHGRIVGLLPLCLVESLLFGRYLVSLPYLNWSGVVSDDDAVAQALIDRAVRLADELDVKHLELRHEAPRAHASLSESLTTKANMRLALDGGEEAVWKQLRSVVRTQIRKGQAQGFTVEWGREPLLTDFYRVFAQNMRDLGTPVYAQRLFRAILAAFPEQAELCIVRLNGRAVAAALAVHDSEITEVPSASVERDFRSTAANTFMYWELILRALQRGQETFDFGRSTVDGSTFNFKKKWGAVPEAAHWQYYRRKGAISDIRPDGGKYDRMISLWKRIPVGVTRLIGPYIVRGIP